MDMGASAKTVAAFEHPADKDIIFVKDTAAHGTKTFPFAADTVNTALYVHHAVLSAVQGGKSKGFYKQTIVKFRTTDRTGPGIIWKRGIFRPIIEIITGLFTLFTPVKAIPGRGAKTNPKKKRISKPEQYHPGNHQKQNLNIMAHKILSASV